jgi:hypothetical protein
MAGRAKRRRVSNNQAKGENGSRDISFIDDPYGSSPPDKQKWNGFCEIESEPV